MRCRVIVATAVASAFLLATALPAGAQNGGEEQQDRRISVTGGLVIADGETVDGPAVSANGDARIDGRVNGAVYVGRGDLSIAGRVTGDVLVLDGDVIITGRVDRDITVLNGKATVRPGADVFGDVTSRTAPTAARGTVRGHVEKLDVDSLFAGFVLVFLVLLWVAVTLSTAVLGLLFVWLFPRAADAAVVAGHRVWASFFLGLSVGIVGPILGVIITASVVGIPLAAAVFGTLLVLGPLGYVVSALIIGRTIVRRPSTGGRIGAFFAGFGILRFGALIPGLGFVVGFIFASYGLGALTMAAWRTGRSAFGFEPYGPEFEPELAGAAVGPESAPSFAIKKTGRPPRRPARGRPPRARPRKTTAKKRAKRPSGTSRRTATARKTGPRKTTAKKRPARAKNTGTKRSSTKRSEKAPARKASSRKTTAKKRTTRSKTSGAKRSSSAATKKRPTRTKRAATKKKRAATKKSSSTKSRTARAKSTTSKKSPARKSSKSRGRAKR
jgi:cytoskeletal protein CcmA (bactofilin family)